MRRACLTALLIVGTIASATLAAPKELTVVLKWNPNEKQSMPALDVTGGIHSLAVPPMSDKRDKGNQIGENAEGKVAVPVYNYTESISNSIQTLAANLVSASGFRPAVSKTSH